MSCPVERNEAATAHHVEHALCDRGDTRKTLDRMGLGDHRDYGGGVHHTHHSIFILTSPTVGRSSMTDITIEMRPNEKSQLEDFVPRAIEEYRDSGLDERADALEDMVLGWVPTEWEAQLGVEEWSTLISSLHVVRPDEGLRVWWLQKKLSRRLRQRINELGIDTEEDDDD